MKILLPLAALAALGAAQGAIDRADFDFAVKPSADFYQYVNGGWLRTHPVPPEYTTWGTWDDIEADVAVGDLHVNGALTEGENIADLGGIKLALAALHAELAQRGLRPAPVGGFTTDQRFFIAFARVWRENTRPEELRLLVTTDPHSPARFRVDGPLSNLPEFYRAFSVPAGAPMRRAPQDRVEIW